MNKFILTFGNVYVSPKPLNSVKILTEYMHVFNKILLKLP